MEDERRAADRLDERNRVGDVSLHQLDPLADDVLRAGRIAHERSDALAVRVEALGDRVADETRGAGDQDELAHPASVRKKRCPRTVLTARSVLFSEGRNPACPKPRIPR